MAQLNFPWAPILESEPNVYFFSALYNNTTGMSVMSEALSQYQLLHNCKEQFEAYSITPFFSASICMLILCRNPHSAGNNE